MGTNHYALSPVRYWLADLYKRPDLVPFMQNNIDPSLYPSGSLRRAGAYRDKVDRNDVMKTSKFGRDAPLTLCCDGTPLFKDRNAGSAIFGILSHAGLDDRLTKESSLTHLSSIFPSFEIYLDKQGVFQQEKT